MRASAPVAILVVGKEGSLHPAVAAGAFFFSGPVCLGAAVRPALGASPGSNRPISYNWPMSGQPQKHSREPKRHHYVPKFVLSPWAKEWQPNQMTLRGYYWDEGSGSLRHDKGVDGFCNRIDLLALKGRREGRAVLETRFFQTIDDKGGQALAALHAVGPEGLSADQRTDFARLLLSLEARRPVIVQRLREEASRYKKGFDEDPELQRAFAELGVTDSPSAYAENRLGWNFEDRALLLIQRLVDNPAVGGRLINASWYLKKLRPEHGSLMLSDRPLIRTHGADHPGATWVLPLGPSVAFVAANHPENTRRIKKASPVCSENQIRRRRGEQTA